VVDLIYEVGDLQGRSNTEAIKEGVTAAMHDARHDGRRLVAITLFQALRSVAIERVVEMQIEDFREAQAIDARLLPYETGEQP
jgi:hypothetical protein